MRSCPFHGLFENLVECPVADATLLDFGYNALYFVLPLDLVFRHKILEVLLASANSLPSCPSIHSFMSSLTDTVIVAMIEISLVPAAI